MITLSDSSQFLYAKLVIGTGNTALTITDDIMQGENNVVDESTSSAFPIGQFVGKYATFTIDNSNQQYNSYNFYGKNMAVTLIGIDGTESIRGTYTISEATKTNDIIEITALDDSNKTDKAYVPGVDFPNTVANILDDICSQCGITHNVEPAHTDAIVQYIPDGTTCHDLIGYLAAIECANARFNYNNVLEFLTWDFELEGDYHDLRDYTQSPDISADTISITGIIVKADSQIQPGVYGEDGYTLTIEIPIIADGTGDLSQDIADYIGERVCGHNFRIMSGDLFSDASIEFGDMAYSYDRRGAQYLTPITSVTFTLQGNTSVKTVAETPMRRAGNYKSDYEKAKEYVDTRTAEVGTISYYLYKNQSVLNIGEDHEMSVGFIRFGVARTTNVEIWHEFKMNCTLTDEDTPMTIRVIYYLNGVPVTYEPVHTIAEDGFHMLNLHYILEQVSPATGVTWDVHFLLDGGTMTIAVDNVHICLQGQGLVSPESFTGFLEVFEDFPLVIVGDMDEPGITETVSVVANDPTAQNTVSENYPIPQLGGTDTTDYITDQNRDNILDQEGEPIIGYEDIISPSVSTPDFTENVNIVLTIDESFLLRLSSGEADDNAFYVGEEIDTGLYNTLYNDSEEEE